MATKLSRADMYERVWSRPRTALAKELGISDVAISKHCMRANVPAPPAGYWARLSAGGKPVRALLPVRLPGQSDAIEIGARAGQWRPIPPENLDEPLAAPVFVENIEEQIGAALKRIGKVASIRDLTTPDVSLARVLAAEERRRTKYEKDRWSYYKPYFDDVVHQRQLRLLSSLARALTPLYGRFEVSIEDVWVEGQGHLHHLVLHLGFGGTGFGLRFHRTDERHRGSATKLDVVPTLYAGSAGGDVAPESWSDEPGRKLEVRLPEIVEALLRRAELSFRAGIQRAYEYRQQRRREQAAKAEAERVEKEHQRIAAAKAQEAKAKLEIVKLARRRRTAVDIRILVAAMRDHSELAGRLKQFEAWVAHALSVADDLDPVSSPLEEVLGTRVLHH